MAHQNAIYFSPLGFATIAYSDGHTIETWILREGHYVRIYGFGNHQQLRDGVSRSGNPIVYHSDQQLADACCAIILPRKEFNKWRKKALARSNAEGQATAPR